MPLPSGAATSSLQSTGNTSIASIDTKTPALGQALAAASVPVVLTASQITTLTPPGTVAVSNFPATQPVSASSLPLPSGASTSANQSTEITSLSSIDAKIPTLGQALAAASVPVVLTAAQLTTLTPLSTVAVTGVATAANQATEITSLGQLHTDLTAALPAGANLIGKTGIDQTTPGTTNKVSIGTDGTVGITGTVPLPTGAATAGLQTTGNTSVGSIDTKTPALGQALAAASVPVVLAASQISTLTPLATVAVTGVATAANQATEISSLSQLHTDLIAATPAGTNIIGKTGIDQTTPGTTNKVSIGTDGTVGITGTVPLPTGAATSALQTTGNTSLTTISGQLPTSLGAKMTANSMAVNMASDQVVNVAPPTLTKGTQGSTGISTQDLKDAGRSQVMLSWEEMTGTAAAESSLTNFTLGSNAGVALSAATSYTVTTGKTLRIQTVTIYCKTTSTVNNLCRFRIRQAASSIANTSPVIFDQVLALQQNGTYLAGEVVALVIPIPDGLEVGSTKQITFTWFTAAITCMVGMSITGYEY